jgi:hypothetical protein
LWFTFDEWTQFCVCSLSLFRSVNVQQGIDLLGLGAALPSAPTAAVPAHVAAPVPAAAPSSLLPADLLGGGSGRPFVSGGTAFVKAKEVSGFV